MAGKGKPTARRRVRRRKAPKWLLPVLDLKLEPGAAFTFTAPPKPGWDGTVNCRFVEIEAQRKLSWTWVVGDIDTVVTFTLTPTASGTRLSLVQSGFKPHQKQNFGGARYGWKMMSGKLVDLLEMQKHLLEAMSKDPDSSGEDEALLCRLISHMRRGIAQNA